MASGTNEEEECTKQLKEITKWQFRERALRQIFVMTELGYPYKLSVETMYKYGHVFPKASLFIDFLDAATGVIKESDIEHESTTQPFCQKLKAIQSNLPTQRQANGAGEKKLEEEEKLVKKMADLKIEKPGCLRRETEKLYQNSRCTCLNLKCYVLLPCSHFECCETCIRKMKHCPQCKEYIMTTIKVYLV